jgi:hypothetical protein
MSAETTVSVKALLWVLGIIQGLIAVVWGMERSRVTKNIKKTDAVDSSLKQNYFTKKETTERINLQYTPLKESIDQNTAVMQELTKVIRTMHADVEVLKSRSGK